MGFGGGGEREREEKIDGPSTGALLKSLQQAWLSQEPGKQPRPPMWAAGTQVLAPSLTASESVCSLEDGIGSKARTRTEPRLF